MGIYGAIAIAVGGLQAQSFALENIAGNIANSQTTAFKRLDTGFADLVAATSTVARYQTGDGVLASSRPTNTVQGTITGSDSATHIAINGNGYLTVQAKSTDVDGRTVLTGADLYTRRGDFSVDREGYFVNGGGYYLMGQKLDPATGNPVTGAMEPVQLSSTVLPAEATTTITYLGNVPAYPKTVSADPSVPGSELLQTADYTTDPTVSGTGIVTGADQETFLKQSIAAGTITAYDANGTPVTVQMRWAKVASTETGGTDTWNLFYQVDGTATGTDPAWRNVGTEYTFDAAGKLTAPTGTVTIPSMTVGGVALGDVTLDHGTGGLTQFDDTTGGVRLDSFIQNGLPIGEMTGYGIRDGGRLFVTYSNGRQIDVAQLPLVSFKGEDALMRLDGGAFAQTTGSGEPLIGATGTIVGGALETSNADIADEFSKLIVTQQAYSANSKVLSTSNDMMQDILNIIR